MKVMDKRIIISLPVRLYEDIKKIAGRRYMSVSGFIRESALEMVEQEFTQEETALINKGRRAFHAGKGINWRHVGRG